jgi:RNA polymerase sigma factor (sigma-70 family)
MGTSPDPADLARRWAAGDPTAFPPLVRAWERPVGRFLARLTGCPATAADLLQETFLRVYLAGGKYADDSHFRGWVYRIALNLARDAGRKKRPDPLGDHDPPAAAADPAEATDTAAAVTAALAALPAPLREAVVLRHYERMSFEEMGRVLGVPATTLKSRYATAADRLRTALAGLAPEDAR